MYYVEKQNTEETKTEEQENKRLVVGLLIQILINGMQQEEFNEMFGDDQERQRKNKEKEEERVKEKQRVESESKDSGVVTPATATGNVKILSYN